MGERGGVAPSDVLGARHLRNIILGYAWTGSEPDRRRGQRLARVDREQVHRRDRSLLRTLSFFGDQTGREKSSDRTHDQIGSRPFDREILACDQSLREVDTRRTVRDQKGHRPMPGARRGSFLAPVKRCAPTLRPRDR